MENADKSRSYSTLNSMYHETRQEIDLLNKQVSLKDNIIADLKARLGRYERIYVTVADKEPLVVGPSQSLLESLCKEICKLKQKKSDMEFRASRKAEVRENAKVSYAEGWRFEGDLVGVRVPLRSMKELHIFLIHLPMTEK